MCASYECGRGQQGGGGRDKVREAVRASRGQERVYGQWEFVCVPHVNVGEGSKGA